MLYTNLKHIETASEHEQMIREHENVIVCCGRMGLVCIPVYNIMEELQKKYRYVKFFDIEFDNPESQSLRNDFRCNEMEGLPYLIYYKNGNPVQITSGYQTKQQIVSIINKQFEKPTH